MNPKRIILSGGPNSVYEDDAFTIDPEIYHLGVPVLGICYGMQLTTKILVGRVERANQLEYGKAMIKAKSDELLFGLPEKQTVWISPSAKIIEIPEGIEVI
ncbi:GMP synthase (glutamine-hydrolyzing), partial [Staphylococcus pseudintermedius]|uniref:glutamine amidotransferase-related protein n=1 Tax=Staphylococcus pseudintermedius TaxID=283734 RepID=UPI000E37055B